MASLESSEFLKYLASIPMANNSEAYLNGPERLPSLVELSKELGVSVAGLREQLEVARALGLVEVRPRTGIRRLTYTFLPAVRQSLSYALMLDQGYFKPFSELRKQVETAFWHQAVNLLNTEDHQTLQCLVDQAKQKLSGSPVQIPHSEHKELHMCIFGRLENPFVQGILEAYWEAYEDVGLNVYTDYHYLQQVWEYHQRMVDAICTGDLETGYRYMVEHIDLLYQRTIGEKPEGEPSP